MFNSPAPRTTPRRPARPRESLFRGSPSVAAPSERDLLPTTPSIRGSRLKNVVRGDSPTYTSVAETSRTSRYDDNWTGEKVYWSRTERYAVSGAGKLPKEVAGLIKNSDMVNHAVAGYIDPISGYAFVTSSDGCIAWNYAKRSYSSPTCYTFPSPSLYSTMGAQSPALASLHTNNASEPGMILVSPSGEIRFWQNLSMALSTVDRFEGIDVELAQGDFADRIWRIDNNVYLITTTNSLVFKLTISSQSGRLVPSIQPLTKSGGMFARASSTIFTAREDRSGINGVTSDNGYTYILAGRTVQKWKISQESQDFVQESDLYDLAGSELFEGQFSSGNISLELNDLAATGNGELALLVSYTEEQSGSSLYPNLGSLHAIIILKPHGRSGNLMVSRVISVSHSAQPDARMLDVARLLVPAGSDTAFIRFAEVIVIVSLSEDSSFEDTLGLKDTGRNAFIGAGCIDVSQRSKNQASGYPLMLMPALGGLMGVEIYTPPSGSKRQNADSDSARLKSKMEQAICFGDRPENPLTSDISISSSDADVAGAAEAVSTEILTSISPYLPPIAEIRPLLNDRLLRLRAIITYLRRNSLLSSVPQSSRRLLSRDAEKAKAAIGLWDHQNTLMNQMNTSSPQSLLSDAISFLMQDMELSEYEDVVEDVVRTYFRLYNHTLDRLMETVFVIFKAAISESREKIDYTPWVLEANKISLIVHKAASHYREDHLQEYEINILKPRSELWTAGEQLLSAMEALYGYTERLLKDRTRDIGSVVDEPPNPSSSEKLRQEQIIQEMLKTQMMDLAAAICTNMEDKLRYTSQQLENGGDELEAITLRERWEELRSRVIRALVPIDRVNQAFLLAEHHSDFATLVWLCHQPKTAAAGTGDSRLQTYIEKFGEEFAFILYQYYIDEGRPHALLSQDEVYGAYVTKFFSDVDTATGRPKYPEYDWLHHIACKRFGQAAESLRAVSGENESLQQKELVSSIGKLAAVASIKSQGESARNKQILMNLDDELELITVELGLANSMTAAAPPRSNKSPVEEYSSANLTLLKSRPAFRDLFVSLANSLSNGTALKIEDLVDTLTLKDNHGDSRGDAAIALDQIVKDRTLPEGRKQVALLSTWRRIFIRDNWQDISKTSGRSEEAQRQELRQTLLYQTLSDIHNLKSFPQNYILSPAAATQSPYPIELSARFPDLPSTEIEALMADHQSEIELLQGYIADGGLEMRAGEVAELVKADREGRWDEDVDVDM